MEFVKIRKEGFTAVVSLNRPPANALSTEVIRELDTIFTELENDQKTRAVVLHGEGRFFSAGADIKEFTGIPSKERARDLSRQGQNVFEKIERFSKPVIAAIHGAALGGGLELAMSCHIRIVGEAAKLGLPELQLGIVPGFGGTQRLPRYTGREKALEMMLTGEPVSGTEAVEYGLALKAVPDSNVLKEAMQLAKNLENKSPLSVRVVLDLVFDHGKYALEKEADYFGELFVTEDAKEGRQAFLEKRKPVFKGK